MTTKASRLFEADSVTGNAALSLNAFGHLRSVNLHSYRHAWLLGLAHLSPPP